MSAPTAAAPAAKHSAPNAAGAKATAPDKKEWKDEIHTPAGEYNANVPVDDIVPDPANRKDLDGDELALLAASIQDDGLVQPIAVRPCPRFPRAEARRHVVDKKEIFRVLRDPIMDGAGSGNGWLYETTDKRDAERAAAIYKSGQGWQIIAGERRWRAHRLNKAKTIRAFVHKGETAASAIVKQTVENSTRKDLNPIEEARQMKRLADQDMPQKEIGRRFGGKSQPVVSQMLKLLDFSPEVQALFATGELTPAHGEGLARFVRWPKACEVIAKEFANRGWDAKSLRGDGIPCNIGRQLAQERVAILIYCGDYEYDERPRYTMPAALQKEYGFFKAGYNEWIYLLPIHAGEPNLWEPEREKQDAARAAKAAAEKQKAAAAKTTGKPTKEQIERKKQIEDNRRKRGALQDGLVKILSKLSTLKQPGVNELAVLATHAVAGGYGSKRLQVVADALGLKVPGGVIGNGDGGGHQGFGRIDLVAKMKPADIAKLAVGVILHKQVDDLCKESRGFNARSLKLYGVEVKS